MASYLPSLKESYLQLAQARAVYNEAERRAEQIVSEARGAAARYLNDARKRLAIHRKTREDSAIKNSRALLELQLSAAREADRKSIYEHSLMLAASALEQLVRNSSALHAQILASTLHQGLELLASTRKIRIVTHAQDIGELQEALQSGFPNLNCEVHTGACEPGSMRLETPSGSITLSWREAILDFFRRAQTLNPFRSRS